MFYVILAIVIFIIGVVKEKLDPWSCGDAVFGGFIGALCTLLIGFILAFLIGSAITTEDNIETYNCEIRNIYALKDNLTTSGSFFLGSGYIDEEMKYYYLAEEDGGMAIKSIKAKEVILHEVDNETPRYERVSYRFKKHFLNWFIYPSKTTKYHFYIPQKSIDYSYLIDLQ